jgi:hypothetical protein
MEPGAIESFYLGNFAGPQFTSQNHLAPWISTALGMKPPARPAGPLSSRRGWVSRTAFMTS